jgi:drug/metabolite transporter (DMT)-like permease
MRFIEKPWLGILLLVITTILYGSFSLLDRAISFHIPFFFTTGLRDLIGAGILLVPLLIGRKFKPLKGADWFWVPARSLLSISSYAGGYYAVIYLPIGTAYFLIFGSEILNSFILGSLLFKERLTKVTGCSLILAILGLWLVYSVTIDPSLMKYAWLAIVAGMGTSIWNLFAKKASGTYSATQLNGLDFLLSAVTMLGLSLVFKETWMMPNFSAPWLLTWLYLLGFLCTGQLVIYGFKHLDSYRGSLILLLEVVFGVIIGAVIFKEHLTTTSLLGGALILAASALPELAGLLAKKKSYE